MLAFSPVSFSCSVSHFLFSRLKAIANLMKGLKMSVDNTEFLNKLMENKMLTVKASENVVRLFPPLIVKNQELDEALSKIEKVCKEMS